MGYEGESFTVIPKNILMLNSAIFGDAYGGSYRFASELGQALAKRGINVHFLAANVAGDKPRDEEMDGIHVHRYSQPNTGNALVNGLQHIWAARKGIRALIAKESFDLLWGHSPLQTAAYLSISFSSGKPKPPLIYSVHSPWLLERRSNKGRLSRVEHAVIQFIELCIIRSATLVHSLSIAMLEETERAYQIKIPDSKSLIFPGGTQRVYCPEDRSLLASSKHSGLTTFFVLRRLEPRMGLSNLIEACAKLAAQRDDFRVIIGGKGSLKADLEKLIVKRGLSEVVELAGFIPEEKINIYYSMSDCMIVPSQELEGFGLVVLEAWARGIPVISTPIGGMKELLTRHTPECIANGIDPESIARKMSWFMGISSEERDTLSTRLRQAVEEYYWDNLIDRYLREIEERIRQ